MWLEAGTKVWEGSCCGFPYAQVENENEVDTNLPLVIVTAMVVVGGRLGDCSELLHGSLHQKRVISTHITRRKTRTYIFVSQTRQTLQSSMTQNAIQKNTTNSLIYYRNPHFFS